MVRTKIFQALIILLLGAAPFSAAQAGSGEGGHDHGDAGHSSGGHAHGGVISVPAGDSAPILDIELIEDAAGGWNLHVMTENFRFAPEHVNQPHQDGEGHAHIYVNGEKIARLYGHWFHIGSLPAGMVEVTVTLNANDHSVLAVGEVPLSVTKTLHSHSN